MNKIEVEGGTDQDMLSGVEFYVSEIAKYEKISTTILGEVVAIIKNAYSTTHGRQEFHDALVNESKNYKGTKRKLLDAASKNISIYVEEEEYDDVPEDTNTSDDLEPDEITGPDDIARNWIDRAIGKK